MRIGSLFTGYGGLDMAVQAFAVGQLEWVSEIDPAACRILEAHHPGVPNLGDVTKVDWATVPPVDVLTGGYPCQPFSHAGHRKGSDDERHLWPYVRDALAALRPMVAVFENVDGHRSLGLADVLGDIADLGMSARWGVVRAADAGAPHARKRVFIVVTQPDQSGSQGADAGVDVAAGWVAAGGHAAASDHGAAADAEGGRRGTGTGSAAGQTGRSESGTSNDSWSPATDADGAGSETRINPRPHSERVRVESVGSAAPATHTDGDGHGSELHPRAVGVESGTESQPRERQRARTQPVSGMSFGKYEPAIRRWERILNRPAPSPTIPGNNDRPRLSPVFVEWMMGLPEGHVTGHGLSNAQALKMLGNGVVPQQALLALTLLMDRPPLTNLGGPI